MNRTIGFGLSTLAATALLATTTVAPAWAGAEGRKNTAAVLAGVAAYSLLKGKTTTGVVAGAGAAVAYSKYKDARDEERRYDRYDREYDRGYEPLPRSDRQYDRGYEPLDRSSDYGRSDRRYDSRDNSGYDRSDRRYDYGNENRCPRTDDRRPTVSPDTRRYDIRLYVNDRGYYLNRNARSGERCNERR